MTSIYVDITVISVNNLTFWVLFDQKEASINCTTLKPCIYTHVDVCNNHVEFQDYSLFGCFLTASPNSQHTKLNTKKKVTGNLLNIANLGDFF